MFPYVRTTGRNSTGLSHENSTMCRNLRFWYTLITKKCRKYHSVRFIWWVTILISEQIWHNNTVLLTFIHISLKLILICRFNWWFVSTNLSKDHLVDNLMMEEAMEVEDDQQDYQDYLLIKNQKLHNLMQKPTILKQPFTNEGPQLQVENTAEEHALSIIPRKNLHVDSSSSSSSSSSSIVSLHRWFKVLSIWRAC